MTITQTNKWRVNLKHLIDVGTNYKHDTTREAVAARVIEGLKVVFSQSEIKQLTAKVNQCLKNKFYNI